MNWSPGQFFNQHSFAIGAVVLWIAAAVVVLRQPAQARGPGLLALAGLSVLLAGIWLALRPGPGTSAEAAEVEALIGQGQPVLVEFYSDY